MGTRRNIYIVIYVVWILVIFAFSLQTGTVSSQSSKWYVDLLTAFFANFDLTVSASFLTTLVRKGAHFTEYAILGFLSRKNVEINGNPKFYVSGLVPFADEYLQTFVSGRSGMLSDSLIDFAGYIAGVLLCRLMQKQGAR